MGTIISKKKKNQLYYYYVESARIDGKPRVVYQKYLGRAERIVQAFDKEGSFGNPKYSLVHEFGGVCALYELARRLGVVEMIDRHCPKRNQGLSVGEYMLLAAINRALDPVSKLQMADWYEKTVLYRLIPAEKSQLSSQRFWDNMSLLSKSAIEKIEDELSAAIVRNFAPCMDCLIYDTTNFFTYINTRTNSELPQRGRCKSKRKDLKIVGLAMMVTPDFEIPLFHEVYHGNRHDSREFHQVVDKLKARLEKLGVTPGRVTLAWDKGNNSLDNMDKVFGKEDQCLVFHIVSSVKFSEHKELLEIPKKEFQKVPQYPGMTAYRLKKVIYEREMTVLIVYNPELEEGQLQGINNNIEKCAEKLNALRQSLLLRSNGTVTKGKKPTVASVETKVKKILSADYMQDVFDIDVKKDENGFVLLDFYFNLEKLELIKEQRLGKTLLFTDNHDWSMDKIIATYRSLYHIENTFKQMKNTRFLGLRPIYHWTDQKIRVHAFYCVLALRLCLILRKMLYENGIFLSVNKMLSLLEEIKQVVTIYPKKGESKKDLEVYSQTKLTPKLKKMASIFDILKYIKVG